MRAGRPRLGCATLGYMSFTPDPDLLRTIDEILATAPPDYVEWRRQQLDNRELCEEFPEDVAMGQLSQVWEQEGGKVVGVAVAESAAQVLRGEGIDRAANLTRFLKIQDAIAQGRASRAERRDYTLTDKSLIVLDEASMMPTAELSRVVALAHGAGAKVLITGDDRQLEAVGAGGAMALLVKKVGAHELREVRRFDSDWEGPASLKLRAGDTEALADYDSHGRLVDGTREAVTKAAYRGFMADHLEGRSALLIVSTTNKLLNSAPRSVRI